MKHIWLLRAQPDYNPNIRHCLYGLDADLIMLGLLSHDPHFCLLREEVKFGPSAKKKGGNTRCACNLLGMVYNLTSTCSASSLSTFIYYTSRLCASTWTSNSTTSNL